jgi:T-complex protein 1 subunit eta
MIVRRAIKNKTIVAGGGATEMELSSYLRTYSRTVEGKTQMIIGAFAKALEIIPRQLCDNAGFDATDILNKLRQKHAAQSIEGRWYGVDMDSEDVQDNLLKFVWEPALVKINMIASASEAACLVLSVDETVKNPQAEQPGQQPVRGRGRGRR